MFKAWGLAALVTALIGISVWTVSIEYLQFQMVPTITFDSVMIFIGMCVSGLGTMFYMKFKITALEDKLADQVRTHESFKSEQKETWETVYRWHEEEVRFQGEMKGRRDAVEEFKQYLEDQRPGRG